MKPVSLARIGIRYINRIAVTAADPDPADYLLMPHPEANALRAKLMSFARRTEYRTAQDIRILITQATLEPQPSASVATTDYLLDIDIVLQMDAPIAANSVTAIIDKTEQLHTIEGDTFEELITENSRRIFDAD